MTGGVGAIVTRRNLWRVVVVMVLVFGQVTLMGWQAQAASLTVNSTADTGDTSPGDGVCDIGTGDCTLRAAIQEVNALGGSGHSVSFSIPTAGPHVLNVGSVLPTITVGVNVDATTQPGYAGIPLIVLDGGGGSYDGIRLDGSDITVQGFVIQDFGDEGIEVLASASDNTITSNYVGIRQDGTTPDGNDDGILIRGEDNIVSNNVVSGNADDGISVDAGEENDINGNFVGVSANGTTDVGNGGEGIAVQFGAEENTIRNNVSSGNAGAGILLRSSQDENVLTGNIIGLNAAGTAVVSNDGDGVLITTEGGGTPTETTIGPNNVISGNAGNGIELAVGATDTVIIGNIIGTNAGGASGLGNLGMGIHSDVPGLIVGGSSGSDRNVISSNGADGIHLYGTSTDVVIRNNYIGVGPNGSTALGNGGDGVYADGDRTQILDNVVSSNTGDGLRLEKVDQIVRGNLIGTDSGGTLDRGNGGDGIDTGSGTTGTQIGGTSSSHGNTIAFNGGDGVLLRWHSGTNGSILRNSIHSNDGLGINLRPSGEAASTVTLNDSGDADSDEPNDLINYPEITSAEETLGTITVDFFLDIDYDVTFVPASYRVEFFRNPAGADPSGFGEGQVFAGSIDVVDPGVIGGVNGTINFPGSDGDVITATTSHCTSSACTAFDRTSEFSEAVTVVVGNYPPVLDPIGPQSGDEGTTISFDADASDLDGDGLTFSLGAGAPAGASINSSSGLFTWPTDEADGPGVYNVTVIVTDNGVPSLTDSEVVAITVNEVNVAPVLDSVGDRGVLENNLLSFTATATDADDPAQTLSFSLSGSVPAGASITSGGSFTWTPTESQGPGVYSFDVVVTDDGSPGLSDSETIDVTVGEDNQAPVLDPVGDRSVGEGSLLSFTATATDGDDPAQTLSFSLSGSVPAGASITSGGSFTWVPSESQGPGVYTFDVVVTDDGSPSLSDSETIEVTVGENNLAPVLGFIGNQTVNEGSLLTFTAAASDVDDPAQTLSFSLSGSVPAGASITSGGSFTWTPSEAQGPGAYTFDVVVTDDGSPNLFDSETITVTVDEVNVAPALSAVGSQSIDEGSLLTFTASASDADDPAQTLSFSLSGSVPAGASITSGGSFTWTPSEAQGPGVYTFLVVVTDDGTPMLSDSESISVTVGEINTAPVLSAVGDQSIDEGSLLTFTAAATDADEPANTLSFSLSGEPAGASVTSAGVFTWTPTEAQGPGTYSFDVIVTDNGTPNLTDTETITVTVNEMNLAPVLDPVGAQLGYEGDVVSLVVTATDGDIGSGATPNTLSFTASGLPDDLTMDPATGEISGTLARPAHVTTVFDVTITVSDGEGGVDSEDLEWTVVPLNIPPTAKADSYSVDQNGTLEIAAPGILSNDSDPEPQLLFAALVTPPRYGDLVLGTDGSFTYSHDGLNDLDDSFRYRVSDGNGGFDEATVTIYVRHINEPPTAVDDVILLSEDNSVSFDPLANDSDFDSDPLVIESIEQPLNGSLRVEPGMLRFIPDNNFHGTTIASYTVGDGQGGSATATIEFIVASVNDAPLANDDQIVLTDYLEVSIPVLLNDTDADSDSLSLAFVTGSGLGQVDVDGDNVVFKPPVDWVGTTVLTYTVIDSAGASATAEVWVTLGEETRATAQSLIGELEASSNDLASLNDSEGLSDVSLSPVEGVSLMVNAFYQTLGAFRLPFVFLGLSLMVLVGLGGATKVPLLLAGRIRNHWSVVLLDREGALRVYEEPDSSSAVIYNFNPTTESVLSTGKTRVVDEVEWMPVHTPRGGGWVDSFHLTEQVDIEEFSRDSHPPKLVREFAERLRNGGDVTSLISERGIVLALTGPPTRLAQTQFSALLDGDRLRMLPTVGGVLHAQDDFRIAVAEPFLAAFDATEEVTAQTAHSNTALIPAEVWNFRYIALGEGAAQPWLVFFEYEKGTPRIAGLGIDE